MARNRYTLSREDIGILMSFATKPEAMTEKWINQLRLGVAEDELHALFRAAGLPASAAQKIVERDSSEVSTMSPGHGFRRAMIGTVAVLVLMNVVLLAGTSGLTTGTLSTSAVLILCGILIVKTIDRLTPGMR